ncbi:MAG: family 78 glycoside hydrolase catalytic domain, partial [Bacteroidota bacterium]
GGQSVAVSVPTLHLRPRQKIYWRVRYWNQDERPSAWSEAATLETGLLTNADWRGQWVGAPVPTDTTSFGRPAFRPVYLRRTFALAELPTAARLYATAKGVFRAYLNGQRIGEDEMAPGWTPYEHRIETLTYDVTDLLQTGENVLAVELAEGWYAGRLGYSKALWPQNGAPRFLAQLESNGQVLAVSDTSWRYTDRGPLTTSSIYEGAEMTQDPAFAAWNTLDFADTDWSPVLTEAREETVRLEPKRHLPVRNMTELPTKVVDEREPGRTVFDLGQNMVGVPRLRVPLRAGDTLLVRFAEMLTRDGEIYTENYRSARSEDRFVATVDGPIDWTPAFTFHGFRYVE